MPSMREQEPLVYLPRAHLEQRGQFYTQDQRDQDGDDWSTIGVSGEFDRRRDESHETSRYNAVDSNSLPPSRWQNRSSRTLHFGDLSGDGAGIDFRHGRGQAVPYTRERLRNPLVPKPSHNPHPNPFSPRPPDYSHPNPFTPRPPEYPHRSNPQPARPYLSDNASSYPTNPPPSGDYSPGNFPPGQYPPNYHSPNTYIAPASQFTPPYNPNANFHQPPPPPVNPTYHIKSEMENVNRKPRGMDQMDKMQQQIAKMQEELDRHEREAREKWEQDQAEERSRQARKKKEEKLKRHLHKHIKVELEKFVPKRDAKYGETQSEPDRRRLEYDPRDLLDYLGPLVADRKIESNARMREGGRGGEADQLLLELKEFCEHKLGWQEGRRSYAGSVRSSWDEPGRGRPEAIPRQVYSIRGPEIFRNEVEEIVHDVLARRVEEEREAHYAAKGPMFPSAEYGRGNRPPRLLSQTPNFAPERDWTGETQRASRGYGQDYKDSGAGPVSPNGSPRTPYSSSHTASGHRDRRPPFDSSRLAGRRPHSPGIERDDKSPRTSAPVVNESQEQSSRNFDEDGRTIPVNAQRDWYGEGSGRPEAGLGYGTTRGASNGNGMRRRRRVSTSHDVDQGVNSSEESEGEEPQPPRSPRPYRRGLDNTIPRVPPQVPDAPTPSRRKQYLVSPEARDHRRLVVHEMEDGEWGPSPHFSGKS